MGLPGNETADAGAKRAKRQPLDINFALPFRDYLRPLQKSIRTTWQSRWSQCVADVNKLGQLRPTIGPWQSSCRQNRHQEVILIRLCIGHTRLTHDIMAREASAICTRCRFRLSVSHILVDSPRYHAERSRFLAHPLLSSSFSSLLLSPL